MSSMEKHVVERSFSRKEKKEVEHIDQWFDKISIISTNEKVASMLPTIERTQRQRQEQEAAR